MGVIHALYDASIFSTVTKDENYKVSKKDVHTICIYLKTNAFSPQLDYRE